MHEPAPNGVAAEMADLLFALDGMPDHDRDVMIQLLYGASNRAEVFGEPICEALNRLSNLAQAVRRQKAHNDRVFAHAERRMGYRRGQQDEHLAQQFAAVVADL